MIRVTPTAEDIPAELYRVLEACDSLLAAHQRQLAETIQALDQGLDDVQAILGEPQDP